MELDIYQIDAFADKPFQGNPAAVIPLEEWLDDNIMQSIALENNLSETAFFIKTKEHFHIRWFTPFSEVDLCGHATLASAYVIYNILNYKNDTITFDSRSGVLSVKKNEDYFVLDFPSQPPVKTDPPPQIKKAFNETIISCLKSEDYILVFDNEDYVKSVQPDMTVLKSLDLRGVIITSRSKRYDFVTRFFAPKFGVNEDPVTGSAFTQLGPFWADELGKNDLSARQVSFRGGDVLCRVEKDRVFISGKAVKFLEGKIILN